MKRIFVFTALAFTTACASAADYPTKPIRIVAPFPPGGSVDLVARLIGAELSKPLGQQFIIDNRTGASGMIGTELAAKSPPDGYTLLVNTLPFVTNQFAFARAPYDPINDFAPISMLASVASVMVSHPALPVNSMKELIALAKAKPGEITYGTAGPGTNPHIAGELLNNLAKIKLVSVHYKGGGPAMIATISGETQLYFVNSIPDALPHIQANKLKALGITATRRNAALPQVPTMAEAGVPGYEFVTWQILAAPKATPPQIIATLNEKIRAVLKTPEAAKRWQDRGLDVIASTPEEAAAQLQSEVKKWRAVFKEQGIKAE
ncbi:MAG TPA: tripartite tricarboxylate transporter substrate binding protein [Burkholderiales bacterium]|nr:tripartite tricarboxylate transporter substrate binding protein [Burkholderiales bacterium]